MFFPYGTLSRGYIIDDAKKAELIAFIKRLKPLMAACDPNCRCCRVVDFWR